MAFIDPDAQQQKSGFVDPDQVEPTSVWEDVKIAGTDAISNVARWTGGLEATVNSLIGNTDRADAVLKATERDIKEMAKQANPKGKEQKLKDKGIGLGLTLPLQLLAFPFGTATTGQTMLDEGETLNKALLGTGIDTAGNMAGVALPGGIGGSILKKAVSGAGINAAQDVLTRSAIAGIADQEGTKEKLGPSVDSTVLSAMLGMAMGPLSPSTGTPKAKKPTIDADQMLREAKGKTTADTPSAKEMTNELAQMELFDQPEMGRVANPYEAKLGDWRVDENGIPIKVDLSMELQNLQNPLQRNLWGDELDPVRNPVGQSADLFAENGKQQGLPLTQAIDQMPDLPWRAERDTGIDMLAGNVPPDVQARGLLEGAQLEAETTAPAPTLRKGRGPAKGGVDPDLLTLGLSRLVEKFQTSKNKQFIDDLMGTKLYQEKTTGEQVVAAALSEGKDGSGTTYLGAGGTLEAAKRRSALVLGTSRIVQRAKNVAEDLVRSAIFPVEGALRAVKKADIANLAEFMKGEQLTKTRMSAEELIKRGGSTETAIAYNKLREMLDGVGTYLNEIRAMQGKAPIKLEDAYMTSVWAGDFRRAVYDADGKMIWMLGAATKKGLDMQTKELFSKFPDLKQGKYADVTLNHNKYGQDATSVFRDMVELLGENDPAVERIRAWAEEKTLIEGRKMLGEEKHFQPKDNRRGFVGDRPANTVLGNKDAVKEATAYMQAQIDVAKAAYKWGEMQKAAIEMKKIFNDAELQTQQPKNLQWAKDYWLDNLGMNDSKIARAVDNTLRDVGLSPSKVGEGINAVKSLWLTQKLLSPGYYLSNVMQASAMMPHLTDIMSKYGGNPLVAIPYGMVFGMTTASSHILGAGSTTGNVYRYAKNMNVDDFTIRAMKYAEDNSVTTRSIYDEAPIEQAYTPSGKAMRTATRVIATPETFLRSVAFMTYAKMLESTGKFTNDLDIFRLAEERVNMSMADYREGERAMAFGKMGTIGTAANTLTTFPINYYNQWSWAAREAKKGNVTPFVAMFATQYLMAGAMGVPGFQDMDTIWEFFKDSIKESAPAAWAKVRNIDLKRMTRDAVGNWGLYGAISEMSDVAMTSRAAAPAGTEMSVTPGAPFIDMAKQVGNVAGAAMDPMNAQKWAQAAYSSAPVGAQGYLETGPFKDFTSVQRGEGRVYGKPNDMAAREGQVFRNPDDEAVRAFGLRTQSEQVERDFTYRTKKYKQDIDTVARSIVDKTYNTVRNGNMDKARDYIKLYTELTGKEMTPDMFQSRFMKEYTTGAERIGMDLTTVEGMVAYKRLKQLLEETKQ